MVSLVPIQRTKLWHATIVMVAVGLAAAGYWKPIVGIVAAAILLVLGLAGPIAVKLVAEAALMDRPLSAVARAEWNWVPIVSRYGVYAAPGFYAAIKLADLFKGRSAVQAISVVAAFAFIEVIKVLDLDGDRIDTILAAHAKDLIQKNYGRQFKKQGGPIPDEGPVGLSDVYLAVTGDDRHGGWTGDGRRKRAQDIQAWIDSQPPPVAWIPSAGTT